LNSFSIVASFVARDVMGQNFDVMAVTSATSFFLVSGVGGLFL
jgi:hypothetical protein